jgi:hypothetical protein
VSQHVVIDWAYNKYVFGWDQPLQTFYLQKHDLTKDDEDDQIVAWLGADKDTRMYEVEDLVREAQKLGLRIGHEMRVTLYGEKDRGE